MEWVSTELATVAGVLLTLAVALVLMVKSFQVIVKNMGARADPEIINIIKTMQENESKRDEVQAELSRSQAESLKSLASSLEYLGQLHQGASTALGVMMEQFKPLPPMAASIQQIEEQSKTMVTNMKELTGNSEQWVPLLKEIIMRLEGVQQTLDELNPVVSKTQHDLKETEREVATIRGHVLDIQKAATQEQEVVAVTIEPTEQGAKPDERTIEQLDSVVDSSGIVGNGKRNSDGDDSEAGAASPVA